MADTPNAPVTQEQLRTELAAVEDRLSKRLEELEDRLIERMRDMQTEIVRVFMQFQQRNEERDSYQDKTAAMLITDKSSGFGGAPVAPDRSQAPAGAPRRLTR